MNPLDDIIRHIRDLPSLPAVVLELLASLEQEDIDVHALAEKITLDQSLTAKTLRLANSSFYGMQQKITTIQQAMSVLGLHSVRTLVTACSVTGSFQPVPGLQFDFPAFWRHALGTAVCSRALALRLGQNADAAFTAGLLHDLGSLVLATSRPLQYGAVQDWQRQHDCDRSTAELAVFGVSHSAIGGALAAYWKFPQSIQDAVAGHHLEAGSAGGALSHTVYLASLLAHGLDLSGEADDQVTAPDAAVWQAVTLDRDGWMDLFASCERQFQDLCQILDN